MNLTPLDKKELLSNELENRLEMVAPNMKNCCPMEIESSKWFWQ